MAEAYTVVGGEMLVAHDGARLPLMISIEALEAWDEAPEQMAWLDRHRLVRDRIMPAVVREYVQAVEVDDALRAVEVVRHWTLALDGRLGKCLSLSPVESSTVPPSPVTSGGDSDSAQTGSPSAPRPRSKRTPKAS